MKVKRYKISLHTEEFGCPWCGCPVYVGDYAYRVEEGDMRDYYCSKHCGVSDIGRSLREDCTYPY